jgi:ribokinase
VRCAVVGHVEWIEFALVEHVPEPGEIAHASETWQDAGGGGPVAAVQLAKLAGACDFFTALGDDDVGHRAAEALAGHGVTLHVQWKERATRRGFVFLDAGGERTITVIGDRLEPRGRLPVDHDAVYFTAGDIEALRSARRAKVLVATPRARATLETAGVQLDALVGSGEDPGESLDSSRLDPPPRVVVSTAGALGGWSRPGGPFRAAEPPGPVVDAYGAGDSFAAGLTYALGRGDDLDDALGFAARCGAAVLAGRGPYEAQLTADA